MSRTLATLIIMTVFVSILGAFASGEIAEHTGRISIKGNDPHTFVALSTDTEIFRLEGTLATELGNRYQNRIVRVVGRIEGSRADATPRRIRVDSFTEVADSME
jgi:hypothetical protein